MRKLFVLFFLLLFVNAVGACVHTELSSITIQRPFLWQAEKAGLATYFFGTIHVGIDATKELPASVWQVFDQSRCFAMEADESAVDFTKVLAMAALPSKVDLKDLLRPEIYSKVASRMEGVLSERVMNRSAPWFVSLLYMQHMMPQGEAMDSILLKRAQSMKKSLHYLEDWLVSVKAFAAVTGKDDLEELVEQEGEAKQQIASMIAAYRSGEPAILDETITSLNAEGANADVKIERLVVERNRLWLPKIERLAQEGGCFVAVGAGHLVGKENVLSLLEAKGYRIERLD